MLACLQKTCLICLFFVTQDGRGNEAVLYNLRHTTKKSNLEATALPFTSSHENKKDKRKEIDVHCLSLPPPTVMKDKGKAIAEPFSSLSPETRQDKGKRAVVLSTPVSGNKAVDNNRRQTAKRRVEVGIRLKLDMSANGCLFLFIDLELFGFWLFL